MASPPLAVVTDIEGTTSAIAFVKESLFPFADAALDDFLDARGAEPEVAAILAEVRAAAEPGEDARAALRSWMATDAMVTPLKALQGLIWRAGFEDGRLRGHLYLDVAPCLRAWAGAGLRLAVYSSGSVEAQRLLFGHSEAGDLAPLVARFFDTRAGHKREAASYAAIAADLGLPPARCCSCRMSRRSWTRPRRRACACAISCDRRTAPRRARATRRRATSRTWRAPSARRPPPERAPRSRPPPSRHPREGGDPPLGHATRAVASRPRTGAARREAMP